SRRTAPPRHGGGGAERARAPARTARARNVRGQPRAREERARTALRERGMREGGPAKERESSAGRTKAAQPRDGEGGGAEQARAAPTTVRDARGRPTRAT